MEKMKEYGFVLMVGIVLIGMVGAAAASGGITMSITPIKDKVLPGETAEYEVNISYFMSYPPTEHVVLSIDNPLWSYSFEPAEFDINSSESKYSTLRIYVPSDAQPGTYTHTVNATATHVIIPPIIIKQQLYQSSKQ